MKFNRSLGLMLASTAFVSVASAALALDGNDVLTKINANLALSQSQIKAESVNVDGDNVTLVGASITGANMPAPLAIGDVTLEEVSEEDGNYEIAKVSFQDLNIDQEGTKVTASDIYIESLYVPANPDMSSLSNMMMPGSFHMSAVKIANQGKDVASIEEIKGAYTVAEDESKVDFDTTISGIKADLSSAPDPKAQEAIKALGLETISGEVTMKGDWTLADGKMTIAEYAFDFENIGRLDFNLALSGYTPALLKSMQDAVKAAESNPDKAAGQQALGMSMMGLMQQLTYNGASIRFDDAGITSKVLDYAGKQQGVDGKQFAESIKGMLPMMLAQMNMPDLQNQIVAAANAYLDDPKSIEVSAEPAQPLPFPQIMGVAMGNPADVAKTLNVQITANQ